MIDQPEFTPPAEQPEPTGRAGDRVLRVVPPEPAAPHPLTTMDPGETPHDGPDAECLKVYLTGPTAFCA